MGDSEKKCIEKLKEFTRHKHVKITNSGNTAIFLAFHIAKRMGKTTIAMPDQGGWLTYPKYADALGLNKKIIKTDYGVYIPENLEKELDDKTAIIVPSFTGYFAEQPLKEISDICKKKKALLIEDAPSAISDSELCNGNYSDIITGSFGRWKVVECNFGGFISVKTGEMFEHGKRLFSISKVPDDFYGLLLKKLEMAPERLGFFMKTAGKIKQDLKGLDVVHREKRGLNVVVKFKNKQEKEKIEEYCRKNKYEFELCPREIRVGCDAISIEVKRMRA